MQLKGLITAIITPFIDDAIDYRALERICRRSLTYSSALVVLGTTAEPSSLSQDERDEIVGFISTQTAKPIIVGVTGNDTASVVRLACHYQALGASALLCPTPYYNRCTQEGLVAHYRALSRAVDVPIILYNVPSRTGVDIAPETLLRLLLLPHVVGVKEASQDVEQIMRYACICADLDRTLICGNDAMLPLFRALGSECAISAAASAVPDVIEQALLIPLADMPRWLRRYLPLVQALFASVNPISVKQACYHLGLCDNSLRLPLLPSADKELPILLKNAGFSIVND